MDVLAQHYLLRFSSILTLFATIFSALRGQRFIYEEAADHQRDAIDSALAQRTTPALQDAIG